MPNKLHIFGTDHPQEGLDFVGSFDDLDDFKNSYSGRLDIIEAYLVDEHGNLNFQFRASKGYGNNDPEKWVIEKV